MGIETVLIADAARAPIREGSLDGVLLDVPCLSTGMIRKYPEIKWRKRLEDLPPLAEAQAALLDGAARTLRPGGHVLYSTCSLEPEENEMQVDAFFARHPSFTRVGFDTLPVPAGFSGNAGTLITSAGDFQALPGPDWMGLYGALLRKSD